MLGLERLWPRTSRSSRTATTLNAHQVDALSGTLIALIAEIQSQGARERRRARRGDVEEPRPDPDEDEIEGDEEIDETRSRRLGRRGEDRRRGRAAARAARRSERRRRFWFEHATGAGKTVAAMGFVEASRSGGILILTHRRNLVDQFLGELKDRGYRIASRRRCSRARTRRPASRVQ